MFASHQIIRLDSIRLARTSNLAAIVAMAAWVALAVANSRRPRTNETVVCAHEFDAFFVNLSRGDLSQAKTMASRDFA